MSQKTTEKTAIRVVNTRTFQIEVTQKNKHTWHSIPVRDHGSTPNTILKQVGAVFIPLHTLGNNVFIGNIIPRNQFRLLIIRYVKDQTLAPYYDDMLDALAENYKLYFPDIGQLDCERDPRPSIRQLVHEMSATGVGNLRDETVDSTEGQVASFTNLDGLEYVQCVLRLTHQSGS